MQIDVKIDPYNQLIDYNKAIKQMNIIYDDILNNNANDVLWLLQHNDVITTGNLGSQEDFLNNDIPVIKSNRGGKYTYHGPGQRVAYVMMNLKRKYNNSPDIRLFVSQLENVFINSLSKIGIKASLSDKGIGIWVKNNNKEFKVASLGIKVKHWITTHGIAINMFTDLNKFKNIVPCGIKNCDFINASDLCQFNKEEFDLVIIDEFVKEFGYRDIKYI